MNKLAERVLTKLAGSEEYATGDPDMDVYNAQVNAKFNNYVHDLKNELGARKTVYKRGLHDRLTRLGNPTAANIVDYPRPSGVDPNRGYPQHLESNRTDDQITGASLRRDMSIRHHEPTPLPAGTKPYYPKSLYSEQLKQSSLIKQATNRSHEVLRSGELGLTEDEVRKLRASIGMTDERMYQGLARGNAALRKRYDIGTDLAIPPKQFWHNAGVATGLLGTNDESRAMRSKLTAKLQSDGMGGSPFSLPSRGVTKKRPKGLTQNYIVGTGPHSADVLKDLLPESPSDQTMRGLSSLFNRHEHDEIRAFANRSKGGKMPLNYTLLSEGSPELAEAIGATHIPFRKSYLEHPVKGPTYLRQLGMLTGTHASPNVITRETRNARMFSPEVQKNQEYMRNISGENQHMVRAAKALGLEPGVLRKQDLGRIAKGMSDQSLSGLQGLADAADRGKSKRKWNIFKHGPEIGEAYINMGTKSVENMLNTLSPRAESLELYAPKAKTVGKSVASTIKHLL